MEVILPDSIVIPEKAKVKAIELRQLVIQAQNLFQIYVEACYNCLNLEGDWDLDANTWAFTKREVK